MLLEKELIRRCQNGDDHAFSEMLDPYLDKAYRTALLILKSKELAEDALQNAMIDMYKAIMEGKEIENIGGWFFRILNNRSIDLLRKRGRWFASFSLSDKLDFSGDNKDSSPQQIVIQREDDKELFEYIQRLKDKERTAIVLFYYQDLSLREIAEMLGQKEGTVKSWLCRGRRNLARLMEGKGFFQKRGVQANGFK